MDFVDIATRYGRQQLIEPILDEDQQGGLLRIPPSMESALRYGVDRAQSQDWILASLGALHLSAGDEIENAEYEEPHKRSLTEQLLHWLGKYIFKRVRKEVFNLIWDALKRIVAGIAEDVIAPIFRFAIKRLIVPVLEMIVGALATPELLVSAALGAVAVGLGFLGKWLFDKYFTSGKEPPGSLGLNNLGSSSTAAPAIPAGEVTVPTVTVAPPPMPTTRQGLGRTFSRLEALIQRGESGRSGYDAYNFSSIGKVHQYAGKPISEMTIAEVQAQQAAHNYNAVGRYQLIRDTLSSAVKELNLDTSQKFDADMQDRIFENYLIGKKRKLIGDYISGKNDDVWAAVYASSQEWASVAAPPGYLLAKGGRSDGTTSYYSGIQGNRASVSAVEMAQILEQERLSFQGQSSATSVTTGVPVPVESANTQHQVQQTPAQVTTSSAVPSTRSIMKHKGVLLAVNG